MARRRTTGPRRLKAAAESPSLRDDRVVGKLVHASGLSRKMLAQDPPAFGDRGADAFRGAALADAPGELPDQSLPGGIADLRVNAAIGEDLDPALEERDQDQDPGALALGLEAAQLKDLERALMDLFVHVDPREEHA